MRRLLVVAALALALGVAFRYNARQDWLMLGAVGYFIQDGRVIR